MSDKKIANEHKKLAGSESKAWYQKFKFTSRMRALWLGSLGILILVSVAGMLYARGYESGRNTTKETVTSPLDAFSAPFERIHTGTVESISEKEITIKTPSKKVSFTVTPETKVKQGKDEKQLSDVKKGKRVTVIRVSDKNSDELSQIILRAN